MRFKDQQVWVRADDDGRPILDPDGRAEMKYREADSKSYRPSPGNLIPDGGAPARLADEIRAPHKAPAKKHAHSPRGGGAPGAGIHIWTDGACSGNPGPMGIGVVVLDGGSRRELGEYLGVGTNNIAELVAIERGLDLATEAAPRDGERRIRVYTDSSYCIGVLSKGWKAKANQELIARLRRRLTEIPALEFVKVEGHAGVPENERCDELARAAIIRRAAV
jgi:ribonuclease HI